MGTKSSARPPVAPSTISGRQKSALADALFTATQQRVLSLLFGQPDREFFVTEIIALARAGRGAVQRELVKLSQSGHAVVSEIGNRKYYQANRESPLFEEIYGIVRKTLGVEESIRNACAPLSESLSLVLLYGSIVRGTETASSDIDLLLVSDDLTLEAVYSALSPAEKSLGRRINPTLYTSNEFRQRRVSKSGFLTRVLEGAHALIAGSLDGA